jgi:hypothetical protein
MNSDGINYRISLEFWGSDNVVLTVGPLQITSINRDNGSWGSFEILWGEEGYLYCHFLEDCDPYNGKWDGISGVAEWTLERLGQKTIWTSLQWFGPISAQFDRWLNRLHGS